MFEPANAGVEFCPLLKLTIIVYEPESIGGVVHVISVGERALHPEVTVYWCVPVNVTESTVIPLEFSKPFPVIVILVGVACGRL